MYGTWEQSVTVKRKVADGRTFRKGRSVFSPVLECNVSENYTSQNPLSAWLRGIKNSIRSLHPPQMHPPQNPLNSLGGVLRFQRFSMILFYFFSSPPFILVSKLLILNAKSAFSVPRFKTATKILVVFVTPEQEQCTLQVSGRPT